MTCTDGNVPSCFTSDECRPPLPRSASSRHRDPLTHDKDVWVASASADGAPYLVPLSFGWDGEALLMATPTTARPAGTWPPPWPFGWGWTTPATCP
jgi:hypothetical protein